MTGWLVEETKPQHLVRWIEMLRLIRERAGLTVPEESIDELIAAAPYWGRAQDNRAHDGAALIVSGGHDYARYQATKALVLERGQVVPDGVTHVGFYARGIQKQVPAIIAEQPNLQFDPATATQLRSTGKPADEQLALIIDHTLGVSPDIEGESRTVLLLSDPEDGATLELKGPVKNTKTIASKPVAWTLGPKVVPLQALALHPATTDELDDAIAALGDP